MMYILNPGDGHDVETFRTRKDALIALETAFASDHNFAALYEAEGGIFRRYERGQWYPIARDCLQNKVIDAAQKESA